MVHVLMLSDKWLSKYGLLENYNAKIISFGYVLDLTSSPIPSKNPGVRYPGMKANRTWYLWCKYECFLTSGCQYMKLLQNFNAKSYFLDMY